MKLEFLSFDFGKFAQEMRDLKEQKGFDYLVTIVGEDFGKEEGLGCVYILENTKTNERCAVKQIAKTQVCGDGMSSNGTGDTDGQTMQYFNGFGGVHGVGEDSIMKNVREYLPSGIYATLKIIKPKPLFGQKVRDQYATAIPIGTAVAQSFNLEVAETCGDIVGSEMERFGVQLWLAPAMNIHRNILCGRTFEYYSEDPLITGRMAAAITRGVQKHKGCGVTLKHFCANNQENNRYRNNSRVSERAMREIYLRGFEICIREEMPKAIMNSYNLLNGVHTSERRDLNTDILRDEFGFDGIIITDWILMVESMSDKRSKYPIQDVAASSAAGTGITMPGSKKDYKRIMKALEDGTLSREQLEINASYLVRKAAELGGYDK